jgi:magnesium transporter/zinc transporter
MESNLEAAARDGWWFWLHLNLGDQRCLRWLTQNLGLRQGLTAEFTGPSLRQHLSSRGDYLTGHLNDFRQEFDRGGTEHAWLHILMAKNYLLTGRVKAVQSAERLRKDLAHGMIFTDSSMLLSHVITNYPDTLDGLHHSLLDELEIVEDHVLDERNRGERKRLMLASASGEQVESLASGKMRQIQYVGATFHPQPLRT